MQKNGLVLLDNGAYRIPVSTKLVAPSDGQKNFSECLLG